MKSTYKQVKVITDPIVSLGVELFPVSEIEAEAAKARLNAVRERQKKHRAKNLGRERARDRERYARKKDQVN